MPVTSYFPPDHDRPPPKPSTPSSAPSSPRRRSTTPSLISSATSPPLLPPTLSRSTSEQLSIPEQQSRPRLEGRRRSSALTDLDEQAIKELSARAKEAERRAQWEGSKLLNLEPPTTPPRARRRDRQITTSPSSLYETPNSLRTAPTRKTSINSRPAPRSPRSREPSNGGYASSIRSTSSSASNLTAVSEFLNEEDPPNSPHFPSYIPPRQEQSLSRTSSIRTTSSYRSGSGRQSSLIFPTTTSRSSLVAASPRSSFDSPSSSSFDDDDNDEEEEEPEPVPLSATFAPRLTKTTHSSDQIVQVLNFEKQKLLDQRNQKILAAAEEEAKKQRERARTKSSTDHSRSESGNSDASFASMTAVGPSPLANGIVRAHTDEEELFGMMQRGGGTGGGRSVGMERDDTLKAETSQSGNRWDRVDNTGAGGPVKSIDEIVKGYKALGVVGGNEVKSILERRRSSAATIQSPSSQSTNTEKKKDPTLEEYQYPSPVTSNLGSTSRPLSANSPVSDDAASTSTSTSSTNLLPYVPFPVPPTPQQSLSSSSGKIKSIEEIIAQHAGSSYLNKTIKSTIVRPSTAPPPASSTPIATSFTSTRRRELSNISSVGSERSIGSDSSLNRELRTSNRRESSFVQSGGGGGGRHTPTLAFERSETRSVHSSSVRSLSLHSPSPRSNSPATPSRYHDSTLAASPSSPNPSSTESQELSLLLKSPRLTRLIQLSRPDNKSATVSLSDVGSPTGHPVLIFLGLGSVRYILALYSELAEIFGLRLICIDRWGLGKTSSIPDRDRGFNEWSRVVEEVVEDHLELKNGFSILGHSAGCPYAVVTSINLGVGKVKGTVHLLAPWVVGTTGNTGGGGGGGEMGGGIGMSADNLAGMYKYLKYVPSGVLKTAQAAEWRIQGWRLGKGLPETTPLVDEKKGEFIRNQEDATVATPVQKNKRESLASLGITGSGEVVDKLEKMYPDGGIRLAGPHLGLTNGNNGGLPSTPTKLNTPRRKGSLSVSGKSLFGGIFASGGGGGSSKSNRSISGANDSSSLRPSLASTSGRRSSYYAASAINSPSPIAEEVSSPRSSVSISPAPSASNSSQTPSATLTPSSLSTPQRFRQDDISTSSNDRPSSPSVLLTPTSPTSLATPTRSSISPSLLISGLLRASHAESLSGSTSDLLVLLDRSNSQNSTIRYRDVEQRVRVWYGDKDDRINESSVRWLEKEMKDCKVETVRGADHNLMTNHQVMFDVLQSISREFGCS